MVNLRRPCHPTISYRPIRPSDLEVLVKIHGDLFPIRYEAEFFHNVVNGRDIVSWGAVDRSRPSGQSDVLIGFITARIVLAKESEVEDLLRFDTPGSDQTLVYILTLGVVESYRNYGIATSLIHKVIKYASKMPTCRAVYLHVISYNNPAILLYKKMSFLCIRRELVTLVLTYMRRGMRSVAATLWKNGERKVPKWRKCKENGCLLPRTQSK